MSDADEFARVMRILRKRFGDLEIIALELVDEHEQGELFDPEEGA
jgi:hypothetical protein